MTSNRIVFFHVPKCAGSTVYLHLSKVMGKKTLSDRLLRRTPEVMIHTKHHAGDIEKRSRKAAHARVIYGHMDWKTYEKTRPDKRDFRFTFLRSPKDRIYSAYRFFCSPQGWKWSDLPGSPEDYSFEDYLEAAYIYQRWQIDNVATRMFSGDFDADPQSADEWELLLATAKKNICRLDFVGFHERFNQDFIDVCKMIDIPPVTPKMENATRENRLIAGSEVSDANVDQLCKWDLQLYRFALDSKPLQPRHTGVK